MSDKNELYWVLREIRAKYHENQRDMAKKLKISPSMLSAIENGKKSAPSNFLKKLKRLYNLSDEDVELIKRIIIKNRGYVRININELKDNDVEELLDYLQVHEII